VEGKKVIAPPFCDRCRDGLTFNTPAAIRTCGEYADWRADEAGDLLLPEVADALLLLRLWCAQDEALRVGREMTRPDA
jgi:hypothetical protein